MLIDLCQVFSVIGIDSEKLEISLKNDKFDDLEDCLQDEFAKEFDADYVITRNTKHFKDSLIKAIEPHEFLQELKNNN